MKKLCIKGLKKCCIDSMAESYLRLQVCHFISQLQNIQSAVVSFISVSSRYQRLSHLTSFPELTQVWLCIVARHSRSQRFIASLFSSLMQALPSPCALFSVFDSADMRSECKRAPWKEKIHCSRKKCFNNNNKKEIKQSDQ